MPRVQLPTVTPKRRAWNRGRIIGQKRPQLPKQVWAIRTRLELAGNSRDLALFNIAIDSKLRGCDLVKLGVADLVKDGRVRERVSVIQSGSASPVWRWTASNPFFSFLHDVQKSGDKGLGLERTQTLSLGENDMKIGELAKRTGLSAHAIRYYERIALLPRADRDSGGQRDYDESILAWIGFLKRLKTTGMPIREMRQYAELHAHREQTGRERKELLELHRERVRQHLTELEASLLVLDTKIDTYLEAERRTQNHDNST